MQYAGWTEAAPQQLTQKEAQRLAKQLKTYVNSTKFIQQGSKVNKVNDQGILVKAPVKDVTYYQDAQGSNPMSAQQLDDFIRTAIITKDPKMLQEASLYRFYASNPLVTQKQRVQEALKDYRRRLSRNSLIWSTILGTAGAALPLAQRAVDKKQIDKDTLKAATVLALAGLGGGFLMAGLTTKKVK